METVQSQIVALLARIEIERGVRILYACESGSRAWGFASPDSDYDVRFVYARSEAAYLSVRTYRDTIDLPMEGDLDVGGWDVKKAASLLGKSNGALVEWLHSPIVYRETAGFSKRWRSAAREVFCPRSSIKHYLGLATQMVRGRLADDAVRAKDYLYALRATLAATWIASDRGLPPVPFDELVAIAPGDVRAAMPALLAHKAQTAESARMERVATLDRFLAAALEELTAEIPKLNVQRATPETLDRLFLAELRGDATADPPPAPTADAFTLERVQRPDMLLLDAVAGSHAYGTAVAGSDEDRRGVFVAPRAFLDGLDTIEQVSDERHDETYYEIGRFVALLVKNNPNALELLAMPEDCVRYRHPLFERLRPELFLSRLCARTFGEYALGQIKRARGLAKKIVNPEPKERRTLLSFCWVPEGQGSVQVEEWLAQRGLRAEDCGLTSVQRATDLYALYHSREGDLRGLVSPKDPDRLVFSSIHKDAQPLAWMHCNEDAFRAHCRSHREYWDWVKERNEERYANNAAHGRGYDSKNLLHTMRLLDMAGEIAREGVIRVRRPNADELLRIRAGEYEYEDLVELAETKLADVRAAFEASSLPDEPDRQVANALLVELRAEFARLGQ